MQKVKTCQNAFPAGAPPRTPLGELIILLQSHSRLEKGRPSPYSTQLDALGALIRGLDSPSHGARHWSAPRFQVALPQIFSSRTTPVDGDIGNSTTTTSRCFPAMSDTTLSGCNSVANRRAVVRKCVAVCLSSGCKRRLCGTCGLSY